jgi:hypothetical protein
MVQILAPKKEAVPVKPKPKPKAKKPTAEAAPRAAEKTE